MLTECSGPATPTQHRTPQSHSGSLNIANSIPDWGENEAFPKNCAINSRPFTKQKPTQQTSARVNRFRPVQIS